MSKAIFFYVNFKSLSSLPERITTDWYFFSKSVRKLILFDVTIGFELIHVDHIWNNSICLLCTEIRLYDGKLNVNNIKILTAGYVVIYFQSII